VKTAIAWLATLVAAGAATATYAAQGELSGIWQARRNASQVLPEDPQFTTQGRAAQDNFDPAADPYLRCIVYMPRGMIAWQPTRIEIVESEDRVWILFEAETINLKSGTSYHWEGLPLSDETRLVERFTRVDDETLEIEITVHDSINYREPWQTRNVYRLDPNAHFFEYECDQVPR
jgi:hypothetical protein